MIFFLIIKIDTQKIYFFFKLSYSKFARDLQNTQTQNPNTQKIENSNPNSNLWVFLDPYVWIYLIHGIYSIHDTYHIYGIYSIHDIYGTNPINGLYLNKFTFTLL